MISSTILYSKLLGVSKLSDQLTYANEKYASAIQILATNISGIRQRLNAAAFDIMLISPEMVPDVEGVQDDIRWIHEQLTKYGRVPTTMNTIRRKTGEKIAKRVVTVYYKLRSQARAKFDT